MSLKLISQAIKETNFKKEWTTKKKFMGIIIIDFKNNVVYNHLESKAGDCNGVYLISDGMSEKKFGLYNGVSAAKKTSTCKGRISSHIRSIKKALANIEDKTESSGVKFVNYFKSKNTHCTTLIVEYIDLDEFRTPGIAGLVEENLINITKGPLNGENKKNVENVVDLNSIKKAK